MQLAANGAIGKNGESAVNHATTTEYRNVQEPKYSVPKMLVKSAMVLQQTESTVTKDHVVSILIIPE